MQHFILALPFLLLTRVMYLMHTRICCLFVRVRACKRIIFIFLYSMCIHHLSTVDVDNSRPLVIVAVIVIVVVDVISRLKYPSVINTRHWQNSLTPQQIHTYTTIV